ncbi:MAG: hypothetical protein RL591_697, partial [Planctomycetota bacterium]
MKRFTPNIRHIASTAAVAGVAAMCAVVLSGTSTNRAEAGPPAPSALSIQQKANA